MLGSVLSASYSFLTHEVSQIMLSMLRWEKETEAK